MSGISNKEAAARRLLGGTVMDCATGTTKTWPRHAHHPGPEHEEAYPLQHKPLLRREDIEQAMVLPDGASASFLSLPTWKNPESVEKGQIWTVRDGTQLGAVERLVEGDTRAHFGIAGYGAIKSMLDPANGWRCIGFQLPNGQRVMVGEVRCSRPGSGWQVVSVRADGRVFSLATDGRGECESKVEAFALWPLDVEATRRAVADRIDREGVPTLVLRGDGTLNGARVVGVDRAAQGGDRARGSVGRYSASFVAPSDADRADLRDAIALAMEKLRTEKPSAEYLRGPVPSAGLLADLQRDPAWHMPAAARGPSWSGVSAGPHVEAEPPPRDHDNEARGLCLGIPWRFGESDQAYRARLDVEEARQVAQKISPLLARPIAFRASIAIPFEALIYTAPTKIEIRYLADSLDHLEADLSRGMRDARAIEEALAGFRHRAQRHDPDWLTPSLERYVAERARGRR